MGGGGWHCSGIDLLTGLESKWGCFKPDAPYTDSHNKKTVKYEHPPRVATEVFALLIPSALACRIARKADLNYKGAGRKFWDWGKQTLKLPILIAEGAKKAGALLSSGHCAIALPGIYSGYRSEENSLIPQLLELTRGHREFIFAFDQDRRYKIRQNVAQAILATGNLLEQMGSKVSVLEWDYALGKGIDDVIAGKGTEFLDRLLESRVSLSEYKRATQKKTEYLESGRLLEFMRGEFEGRLSWDGLRSHILLDRKPIELNDSLRFWFIDKFKYKASKEDLQEVMVYMAKLQSFNPVERYLNECYQKATRVPIDDISTRYFQTEEKLYDIFVRRFLIGCVARCLSPGCKLDTALILQGNQGIKKSTFFDILGGEWFDDSLGDINYKDALLVLHSCWIQELGEFERITSKKAAGEIKAFTSRRIDKFREPYAREAVDHPRRSVICGSVNKDSFLLDETGNRRFWIIPIPDSLHKIDVALLQQERNGIWGSAMDAYHAGEQWWLTDEEEALSTDNNRNFEVNDTWEAEIEEFLEEREKVSIREILFDLFGIAVVEHDKPSQMRVRSILVKLGWAKSKRNTYQGKRQIVWERSKFCEKTIKGSISEKGVPGVAAWQEEKIATPATPATPKSLLGPNSDFSQNSTFSPGQQVLYRGKQYKVRFANTFTCELEGLMRYVSALECTPVGGN